MNPKVLIIVFLGIFLVFGGSVRAETLSPEEVTGTPAGRLQNKLSEARLRACQAREESIRKRRGNLVNMAVRMEGKFDAISQRVKDFYADKVLPTGKTVDNYDSLAFLLRRNDY